MFPLPFLRFLPPSPHGLSSITIFSHLVLALVLASTLQSSPPHASAIPTAASINHQQRGQQQYSSLSSFYSYDFTQTTNSHAPQDESSNHHDLVYPCPAYTQSFPRIACLHRHGSVIRGAFERKMRPILGDADTYPSTHAPGEPSFSHLASASFFVFNPDLAAQILGPQPSVDFMFRLPAEAHEAPVYVPPTHELYFSRLQKGYLPQLVVDLKADPPELKEKLATPPIYAATGARWYGEQVYFSTIGGNSSLGDDEAGEHAYYPGIYTLNVTSGESRVVVNNYYGYYFNAADDLDIDREGMIYFSDNDYGRPCGVNTQPPQLPTATYLHDPATGLTTILESSLDQPNGVALSPDGRTLFLSDTGAGAAVVDPSIDPAPGITVNMTGPRTLFAYDVFESASAAASYAYAKEGTQMGGRVGGGGGTKWLGNKRPLYLAMDYAPDGVKVSRDGRFVVAATGHGVDVLAADSGVPVVRVQTNFTVVNVAFAAATQGGEEEDLWMVGVGGVGRVRWALKGL